jgi:hypothetical protein
MEYAVAQLVKALSYKAEGSGFDSWWCSWYFHLLNPSVRTMSLESAQPLAEMSTRGLLWGFGRLVFRVDNLATFMCRLPEIIGSSTSRSLKGLSRLVQG